MATFGNIKIPKNPSFFYCENCDYNTCSKKDFNKHLETQKHFRQHLATNLGEKIPKLKCEFCDKNYSNRSGLWRHKKNFHSKETGMITYENIYENNDLLDKEIVISLLNDNKELRNLLIDQAKESNEFKNMMMEVIKNGTHNTTNLNSHNKSFNLNLFLNETCKNAMNITDFVDSLKIQLVDLENVGEVGFINGISNIIVKNLKDLDITQRPVHCTDSKREVLYVKDENKWEKEDEENIKLRKVIKHVAFKNSKMLQEFRKKHPDCGKSDSKYSDQYNKLVVEAMGGRGDNDKEKEDKIIRKIAKEVVIEK